MDSFDPRDQKRIRSVRAAVRTRLPTADELLYDYNGSFVIAYSQSERGSESIVSLAARPDGVRLYFTEGIHLPDPKELLEGSGRQTRFIRVESASELAHPDVEALIVAAIDRASVPLPSEGRGRLVVKTSAAKKRAR
jgi:hypothetical protein